MTFGKWHHIVKVTSLLFLEIDLFYPSLKKCHKYIQIDDTGWRYLTKPVEDTSLLRADGHNLLLTDTMLSDESSPTDAPLW